MFFEKRPSVNPAIDSGTCRIDVSINVYECTVDSHIYDNENRWGLCPQDHLPTGLDYECQSEGCCTKLFEILMYLCGSGCSVVALYWPDFSHNQSYLDPLLQILYLCGGPVSLKATAKHVIIKSTPRGRYRVAVESFAIPTSLKRYLFSGTFSKVFFFFKRGLYIIQTT